MSTFTLRKRFTFEAAHFLPHHAGKCRRMHGHSWAVWVEISGRELQDRGPASGMLLDYADIAAAAEPLLEDHLDHYCLNDTLGIESPTSELVARWVFDRLAERGLPVSAVTIEETCTSACTYRA